MKDCTRGCKGCRTSWRWAALMLGAVACLLAAAAAQAADPPRVTVSGVVRRADSGEPLARALVRLDGDASTGALTDENGRFEIPGVAAGPQLFEVMKPGFLDTAFAAAAAGGPDARSSGAHNVIVAPGMADLTFTLARANSIRGQVQLSTGDRADGIPIHLLKRTIENGRAEWQIAASTRTNSEGRYRFGGLSNGSYAVYSDSVMDSDPATDLVEPGSARNVARSGYPGQFYPSATDLSSAARIQLQGGDDAEANLSLALEPFYTVTASVPATGTRGTALTATVLDAQGHALSYPAQYDATTHTVQAILPDGSYSLRVNELSTQPPLAALGSAPLAGSVDFAVAGHAVSNLRIPMTQKHTLPVAVEWMRSASGTMPTGHTAVLVLLSEAGEGLHDGMVTAFAQGSWSGPLRTSAMPSGSYWVHTNISSKTLCEASFTAGSTNLGREPLRIRPDGSGAPLTLTLRDDCASLTLALPGGLAVPSPGEEPYYTVYAVPDFDSTVDVIPLTLRPSTGGSVTLQGLTPGSYHVYAFDRPVALEYRNRNVLAALPHQGQAVTLSPGMQSNLVLEALSH